MIPFEETLSGHAVGGFGGGVSKVFITPGNQYVVTHADDGAVTLREADKLPKGKVSTFYPHDFRKSPADEAVVVNVDDDDANVTEPAVIIRMAVARDLSSVYACGADGVISAFRWRPAAMARNVGANGVRGLPPLVIPDAEIIALKALMTIDPPSSQHLVDSLVSDSGFDASTARSGASLESLEADTASTTSSSENQQHQQQTHLLGGGVGGGDPSMASSSTSLPNLHQQHQQPIPTWVESQRAAVLQKENRKFAEVKKELRVAIADIRTSLKIFMDKNER